MNQTKIISFVLCGPKFHGELLGEVSATKLIADFIISMTQALLNYFESEKLLYLPPPQQKLIFWFKDNLGRISTTENCILFFLSILWWLSLTNTHIPSNSSGQEGSILPPEV